MSINRDNLMWSELNSGYYGMSLAPQRRYRVTMDGQDGPLHVHVMASSASTVIDQINGRRIATPPGLKGFQVSEVLE